MINLNIGSKRKTGKTVAYIPARGGSKSIPKKNIKAIAGRPLIYWVLQAAENCLKIDEIYVATDDEEIKRVVENFRFSKVRVIGRSKGTATDMASTESAMLEFASGYQFDHIILIQATSPLLRSDDLENGLTEYTEQSADSVLSVVRQKRFIWELSSEDVAVPYNYAPDNRPRRQDFDGFFVENGAFYITSRKALMESGVRISGTVHFVEMPENTYFEIDEPADWRIVEQLLLEQHRANIKKTIKMFLSDCDGCLTDGGMYYGESGDELKKFNTRDGEGFRLLKNQNIITGIITGEENSLIKRRAEKMGLNEVILGEKDKCAAIGRLCKKYGINMQEVCYIGDDEMDVEAIKEVGLGCAPIDAMPCAREAAKYISKSRGGEGVVREIAEMVLFKTDDLSEN